ncbi:type II toxin-antitoxin system mRNA interferase toxin, RelE/StbE family [Candidatus Parcubacteria bacterium]|nr:type II toxin-antitoxin system mRNA interferase toxin, RelE/StbE family [Candidatus Parcubacteria bacterium]
MQIITDKKFDKRFKKQSAKIKKEFEKRMEIFIEDFNHPILKTHKLSGGNLKGLWSFNLSGDIRVVFDRSQKEVIILIDIGSHSELYS